MKFPLASLLAAAAALAFAAGAARAEESAGYAGLSIGMVSVPTADDRGLTESDTSLAIGNIYVGVRLTEFLGVEAGYLKSTKGDLKSSNRDFGDYDVSTLHGALVGRIPFEGDIGPFAKVGLQRWRYHAERIGKFSGTDLMLGGGIDWAVGDSGLWVLRAEYMYLPYNDRVIEDGELHAFLIGAHRRF